MQVFDTEQLLERMAALLQEVYSKRPRCQEQDCEEWAAYVVGTDFPETTELFCDAHSVLYSGPWRTDETPDGRLKFDPTDRYERMRVVLELFAWAKS